MNAEQAYRAKLEADRAALARRVAFLKEATYEALAKAARVKFEYQQTKRK